MLYEVITVDELQLLDGRLSGQGSVDWRRDQGLRWRAQGQLENVSAVHPQGLV